MKINISRDGGLAFTSGDGSISIVSTSGQFSLEATSFGFGYQCSTTFSPGKFYFLNKKRWRRKIFESKQRIKQSLKSKGLLNSETAALLDKWK